MNSLFDDAPVISCYSRSQAIEDGVLVDLTANFPDLIRDAGFKYPIACTSAVFSQYIALTPAAKAMCNDLNGRAWDVLWMLKFAIRNSRPDQSIIYVHLNVVSKRKRADPVVLKAVVGPGDDAEPVITIMLPDED